MELAGRSCLIRATVLGAAAGFPETRISLFKEDALNHIGDPTINLRYIPY